MIVAAGLDRATVERERDPAPGSELPNPGERELAGAGEFRRLAADLFSD